MKLKLISTLALIGALTVASSQAVTITTSGTLNSLSVSGSAAFTFGANYVDITLTNLTNNPTGVVQLLNGLTFDINGAALSGSLTRSITASSGKVEIASGGSYTLSAAASSSAFVSQANSLDRWQASGSGSSVTLTTLSGGNPNFLIIGNPDNNGDYSNANAGVRGDNPSILVALTAHIDIAGVTANSTLGNVTFRWGTSTENTTTSTPPQNDPPSVPDSGTTVLLLGGALVGLFLVRHSLRKSR